MGVDISRREVRRSGSDVCVWSSRRRRKAEERTTLRRFDGVSLKKLMVEKYTEKELLPLRDHGIEGTRGLIRSSCSWELLLLVEGWSLLHRKFTFS